MVRLLLLLLLLLLLSHQWFCSCCCCCLQDFPGVGWTWFAYNWQPMNKYAVVDQGKGLKGSAASCAELQANGGMTWACR
jgi:hypothetical protein